MAYLVDLPHSSGAKDACYVIVADLVPNGNGHVLSAILLGSFH
jgi:hypothetical protein